MMNKPNFYNVPDEPRSPMSHISFLKPYPLILRSIARSVGRLLLINVLILGIAVYIMVFTDVPVQENYLKLFHIVLNGLILYFTLYPCARALFHLANLHLCNKRLHSSKPRVADIISEPDYLLYIELPLQHIRILYIIYPLVLLLHLSMAFTCYYIAYHFL